MAAQERTKQAPAKPEAPQPDVLMAFDAPPAQGEAPPPAFDSSLLPPPPSEASAAPPPFEAVEEQMKFPAPPPIGAVAPPPAMDSLPPPSFDTIAPMSAPPAPSAPSFAPSAPAFEDLLDPHPAPPPLDGMQALPPPPAPEPAPQIDEDVLAALDPAEREALLEEQRQIMAQIEKNKTGNMASGAAARALAFDQRSNTAVARAAGMMDGPSRGNASRPSSRATAPASSSRSDGNRRTVDLGAGEEVPLHGQERTQQAIKDGTAILVQCVNCQNWMQVTDNATLMFCPVCQVVSPVETKGANTASNMEQAQQMDADQKLAEQLQREEYKKAGNGGGSSRRQRQQQQQPQQAKQAEGQSWYDWIVGNPAPQPSAAAAPTQQQRSTGLVSAQTGEERRPNYNSYDARTMGSGARVAEQKSMFACVADSIATAATSVTATNLSEDREGNVHGVDSSSLLAMPQVSRQRD